MFWSLGLLESLIFGHLESWFLKPCNLGLLQSGFLDLWSLEILDSWSPGEFNPQGEISADNEMVKF